MSNLDLGFVVYLGDPDEGAEAVRAPQVTATHADRIEFPHAYGALTLAEGGKDLIPRRPDPILPLITSFVKALPYLIEGEPETVLLSESEHGFMLTPTGEDVFVSFFAGDAFEPDEMILDQKTVPLDHLGQQILDAGEQMERVLGLAAPDFLAEDDYAKSLVELLDVARQAFKTYRLAVQRGLRVQ